MKRTILIISLILSCCVSVMAGCYDVTRQAGIDYMNKGNLAKAEECFRAALVCPDKPASNDIQSLLNKISDKRFTSEFNSAKALYNKGKYAEAKSAFQKLLKKYPGKKKQINSMISQCDQQLQARIVETADDDLSRAMNYISDGDYSSALPYLRKAANAGNAQAQYLLGDFYEYGKGGLSISGENAVKWYEKAAAQDHIGALNSLGFLYFLGEIVPEDYEIAYKNFYKTATMDNSTGMFMLGLHYEYGEFVSKNIQTAIYWYEKAAEQGDNQAKEKLEELRGTSSNSSMSAEELYDKGMQYYNNSDYETALEYFEKGAELGHSSSMLQIGWLYDNGLGVIKDSYEATRWYRKSAELGNAQAQYNLGWNYENGEGVNKNIRLSFEWYLKSAKQGNIGAQNAVGECYYYGKGVEKDLYEAVRWYLLAAEEGNKSAQYSLGWCYEHGEGVEQSYSEARYWYRKAADQGHNGANERLDNL